MSSADGWPRSLLVLSAVHNNEATLEELHERLVATLDGARVYGRFLYVDDGSTDGSWALVRGLVDADPRVAGIRFRGNFGQTRALCAGLEAAEGDAVVYIDADLEIPPEAVASLVPAIAAGHDFVGGDRSHDSARTVLRRLGAKAFNATTRVLTGLDVRDVGCGLVAMGPDVVDAVVAELRRRPVQIIKPAMMFAARDPVEVPIASDARRGSAYSNAELLRFAAEFVALRAAAPLGVLAAGGAVVSTSRSRRPATRVVAGLTAAGAICTLLARVPARPSTGGIYSVDERIGWAAGDDLPVADRA